ncbi:hypothetical protein H6P81_001638 [Aristolochia fimbriata]|uniref:Uncharacterized protein n=1 Tax=Aristolochia fimbriata TaxID=158543 RepID=A0AAV7F7H1_ARIFI|nr:hypothetical protein H6P81_001638 [Aristolochia fimbriata]
MRALSLNPSSDRDKVVASMWPKEKSFSCQVDRRHGPPKRHQRARSGPSSIISRCNSSTQQRLVTRLTVSWSPLQQVPIVGDTVRGSN